MFRFQLNATCRIVKAVHRRPRNLGLHPYSYSTKQYSTSSNLPPVRSLGPTLWVLTVAGSIYLGCAAYEVRHDAQDFKKRLAAVAGSSSSVTFTYDNIDAQRITKAKCQSASTMGFSPMELLTTPWKHRNSAEKMLTTCAVLNASIYSIQNLSRSASATTLFWHIPATGPNFTLLTCMFGHASLFHLGLNMYALFNFGPPVAASPTFQSSGCHLTAFYLSSGLLASLSQHLSSIWPHKTTRLVPSLGASGAIMAMLGAWAMNYPHHHVGIVFLPGISFPAEQALLALFAFEIWGAVIGFGSVLRGVGHAAHLGGLCVGVAYVRFDGGDRLWQPTRRFAFNLMRRLNLV